jgi:hypothetical protein
MQYRLAPHHRTPRDRGFRCRSPIQPALSRFETKLVKKGIRGVALGPLLFVAAVLSSCTEPERLSPLQGDWEGTASPELFKSVKLHLRLISAVSDTSRATGMAELLPQSGYSTAEVLYGGVNYEDVDAQITGSAVSITMRDPGGTYATTVFSGTIDGQTMVGQVSGGKFPTAGSQILLVRSQ